MEQKQTPLEREIKRAQHRLEKARAALDMAGHYASLRDLDRAYHMTFDYEFEVEKLVLQARLLPAITGFSSARTDVEKQMANVLPIRIGHTGQGWFTVEIPALLPKKEKGSPDYIRDSLRVAMQKYFDEHEAQPLRECVLIFRHCYSRDRPARAMRDHDNIELNAVVDVLALYMLTDDAPYLCSHYYCSAIGDHDATEVYLVPTDEFIQWIAEIGGENDM